MASTIVEVQLPTGLTATLSLYADGSDTLANSGGADTLTEATNRLGLYTATVTEALDGLYFAKLLVGANVIATGWIDLVDDTSTYTVRDDKESGVVSTRTAIGMSSANLDTQLANQTAIHDNSLAAAVFATEMQTMLATDGLGQFWLDVVAFTDMPTSTLNASDIRDAIGMASADLDTQLDAISSSVSTGAIRSAF